MDDETRKRIEKHRVKSGVKVPPGVMSFVRQAATPQMVASLLKAYDDGQIDAVDFVELIRAWVKGES